MKHGLAIRVRRVDVGSSLQDQFHVLEVDGDVGIGRHGEVGEVADQLGIGCVLLIFARENVAVNALGCSRHKGVCLEKEKKFCSHMINLFQSDLISKAINFYILVNFLSKTLVITKSVVLTKKIFRTYEMSCKIANR